MEMKIRVLVEYVECKGCQVQLTTENIHKSNKRLRYCKLCSNKLSRDKLRKMKQTIVDMYGGKCACCNETLLEFLTVDHSNNDGSEHRKLISTRKDGRTDKFSGDHFYRWIVRNNYPKDMGFRILCWNCNSSIGAYGYCPHNKVKD